MIKRIFAILPWILLIILILYLWNTHTATNTSFIEEDKEEVNHHIIVERMEALGKLELVKLYIKDIVEHKVVKDWWPDPKVILIISGEVAGCINLAKIDSQDVYIDHEKIIITLPPPELCYFKINHKESKVHSMENEYFTQSSAMIDKAYKIAEDQLESTALNMQILEQTKVNAEAFLKPLLEDLTQKKVVLQYTMPPQH